MFKLVLICALLAVSFAKLPSTSTGLTMKKASMSATPLPQSVIAIRGGASAGPIDAEVFKKMNIVMNLVYAAQVSS